MIWVIRKGTGLMCSSRQIMKVIGPTSRTVVTLSSMALNTAVTTMRATMIFHGSPRAILAALMARYSKSPDSLMMPTKIIIAMRTPRVLASMWCKAVVNSIRLVTRITIAPKRDAIARCTFSVTMRAMTAPKMSRDAICDASITVHLFHVYDL